MIKLTFNGETMELSREDAEELLWTLEADGVDYQWENLDPQPEPATPTSQIGRTD